MQREATQDASGLECEVESSVRDLSCSLPLQRPVHAICQRGACEVSEFPGGVLRQALKQENRQGLRHQHVGEVQIPAADALHENFLIVSQRAHKEFVPSWEKHAGRKIQFGADRFYWLRMSVKLG